MFPVKPVFSATCIQWVSPLQAMKCFTQVEDQYRTLRRQLLFAKTHCAFSSQRLGPIICGVERLPIFQCQHSGRNRMVTKKPGLIDLQRQHNFGTFAFYIHSPILHYINHQLLK
jgi:hypothetical protein